MDKMEMEMIGRRMGRLMWTGKQKKNDETNDYRRKL